MEGVIILLGREGSGKSTIAKTLEQEHSLRRFSSGDLVRRLSVESPAFKSWYESNPSFPYIPDTAMNQYLLEHLPSKGTVVLDGVPRTLPQAEFLAKYWNVRRAVLIDVPEDECRHRIVARAIEQQRRDDLTSESINSRFALWEHNSPELINFYQEASILRVVDGKDSIQGVYKEVVREIK